MVRGKGHRVAEKTGKARQRGAASRFQQNDKPKEILMNSILERHHKSLIYGLVFLVLFLVVSCVTNSGLCHLLFGCGGPGWLV